MYAERAKSQFVRCETLAVGGWQQYSFVNDYTDVQPRSTFSGPPIVLQRLPFRLSGNHLADVKHGAHGRVYGG